MEHNDKYVILEILFFYQTDQSISTSMVQFEGCVGKELNAEQGEGEVDDLQVSTLGV